MSQKKFWWLAWTIVIIGGFVFTYQVGGFENKPEVTYNKTPAKRCFDGVTYYIKNAGMSRAYFPAWKIDSSGEVRLIPCDITKFPK